uniref:Uncharacterized protein n=1 Tax=Arundo donax TaxID=35708 RepID=A0A0A9AHQ4_ARUDO
MYWIRLLHRIGSNIYFIKTIGRNTERLLRNLVLPWV